MHELSLCSGLLHQVQRVAAAHGAQRVAAITLRIGPLSGVEPTLLQQAFAQARAGTVAASARLAIEAAPVRVHCLECGHDSDAAPNRLLCDACGGWRTRLLSGAEILLVSVELGQVSETAADGENAHV